MQPLEFKVVVIGSTSVGKTSLTNQLQFGEFDADYQPTIGAGYVAWHTTSDSRNIELQIWDTAGMERYRSLGPIYYRDAAAALIVYDQADQASADALPRWLAAFRSTVKSGADIAIVANKDDLSPKSVAAEPIRNWANENQLTFFTTSAKTGLGVRELFDALVTRLVQSTKVEIVEHSQAQLSGKANMRSFCC